MFDFLKRFSKKAVTGSAALDYNNLFKIISGNTETRNYSAQELVKLNNGWVYSCLNKNAMTVATTPLHLYYNNQLSKSIRWTNHRKLDKKEVTKLKDLIPYTEIKQSKEIVEITDHPFLDLLKNINPTQNYTDFTYLIESYLGLIGNAYVLIVRESEDGNSLPKELHILQSENVAIMINDLGQVTSYKYTYRINGVDKFVVYKPEDIVHIKNSIPGSTYYGKGELESCLMPVERYNYYDLFECYLNRNYSRPDFIVSYKGKYSEKELRDAQKQWNKQFVSPKNAGKPLITSELDINNLGYSPRDMMFKDGREWCKKEIAAVFGVPESLLTVNDSNLASAKSARQHYYNFTITPKLRMLCEKYNEQLLPLYDSGLFLWYSDKDFLQPEEMTYENILSAQTQGILSVNECREALGYEPNEDDDLVVDKPKEEEEKV